RDWSSDVCSSDLPGVPYRVGPSMLGMRDNPYGAAPVPNPENRRIAMALNDPRQRGLFGAAWNLGYAARMAAAGVEALTLSAPVGAFGVVYAQTDFPQPWYAERGRGVYPVYHVLRGLAAAAGAAQLATAVSHGSSVQALAYRRDGAVVLWLANLTGRAQRVRLEGLPGARARATLLACATFEEAAAGPERWDASAEDRAADAVELDAYAVARLEVTG